MTKDMLLARYRILLMQYIKQLLASGDISAQILSKADGDLINCRNPLDALTVTGLIYDILASYGKSDNAIVVSTIALHITAEPLVTDSTKSVCERLVLLPIELSPSTVSDDAYEVAAFLAATLSANPIGANGETLKALPVVPATIYVNGGTQWGCVRTAEHLVPVIQRVMGTLSEGELANAPHFNGLAQRAQGISSQGDSTRVQHFLDLIYRAYMSASDADSISAWGATGSVVENKASSAVGDKWQMYNYQAFTGIGNGVMRNVDITKSNMSNQLSATSQIMGSNSTIKKSQTDTHTSPMVDTKGVTYACGKVDVCCVTPINTAAHISSVIFYFDTALVTELDTMLVTDIDDILIKKEN